MFDTEKLKNIKYIFKEINEDFEDISDDNEGQDSSFEEQFKNEQVELLKQQMALERDKAKRAMEKLRAENEELKIKLAKRESRERDTFIENKGFLSFFRSVCDSSSLTIAINHVKKYLRDGLDTSNTSLLESFKSFLLRNQNMVCDLQQRIKKLVDRTTESMNQVQHKDRLTQETQNIISVLKEELSLHDHTTESEIAVLQQEVDLLKKDKIYLENFISTIQKKQQDITKYDYKILYEESKRRIEKLTRKLKDRNKENHELVDKVKEMLVDRKNLTSTIKKKLSLLN